MSISKKDKEYIQRVTQFYLDHKTVEKDESIRSTAIHFGINRNKVRKILITSKAIESDITDKALDLKRKGLPISKIAKELGVSTATVSMYLPYENVIKDTLDPSDHTQTVREYRAYEKRRAKRQIQNNKNSENEEKLEWIISHGKKSG